jgi:NAD(P)-dependent dehydrogenase (short-subunit alcohol dehydrogenase family)
MLQAFLPLLRQASPRKGRVINISSVVRASW